VRLIPFHTAGVSVTDIVGVYVHLIGRTDLNIV
jgi:hypothetical protein